MLTRAISVLGNRLPRTRAGRLLILIYHRVRPKPDPMFPGEVDATRFGWQMELLARFCNPIGLSAGVEKLIDGSLGPRAVAVTFDDGYADNSVVALPILKRYGIQATFFVAPGFLDGGRMWNDSVIEAIRATTAVGLDLSELEMGVNPVGEARERGALAESVLRRIKHLDPDARNQRVAEICRAARAELPTDLMMTSAQVRGLVQAGMEVGAHTMSHPILKSLSSEAALAEIADSRSALEEITGQHIAAFAYPNGRPVDDYSDRDRSMVASLGFDYALSTVPGAATCQSDIFQLPRFTPWDRTPARWLARLLAGFGRVATIGRPGDVGEARPPAP